MSVPMNRPGWNLVLRLDRAAICLVIMVVMALIFLALAATWVAHSWTPLPSMIRWQITLAAENNVAVWFSSVLLFSVAIVAIVCRQIEREALKLDTSASSADALRNRASNLAWPGLAVLFVALSLDEMGSLHERLDDLVFVTSFLPKVDALGGWVGLLAIPIAVLVVSLLCLAWFRFRHIKGVAALMILGVLLYLTVPIQEHFEVTSDAANRYANSWGRPAWQILLEEGAELFGTLCFLAAGLWFAEYRSRCLRGPGETFSLEFGRGLFARLGVLYGAGLAALYLLVPDLVNLDDTRGIPVNWFPATLAFLCAVLAFHLGTGQREKLGAPAGSARALHLIAIANLALSVGYGANYPVYRLLENREMLQSGWLFVLSAGFIVVGIAAARVTRSPIAESGVVAWTFILLLRPFFELQAWPVLAVASQLALLVGLQGLLTERASKQPVAGWRVNYRYPPARLTD